MPIKTYLVPSEITKMIESATNLRDQVILSILSDTGCRVSELLALSVKNFDLERQVIIIPHLKRGIKKTCPKCEHVAGHSTKFCTHCGSNLTQVVPTGIEERTRMVSLGKPTAVLLDDFITRSEIGIDELIFPLSRQMVYKIVRDAADASGLHGKLFLNPETGKHHYVHPHDFRSSLAVSWLEYAAGDASKQKALQVHLGHKSFDTTQRYNKLTPSTVKNIGDEVREQRFGNKEEHEK